MGASFSGLESKNCSVIFPNSKPDLGELPESCIALILSHLDPSQICKIAAVNKTFFRASLCDFVWESKLPENHQILVKRLFISDECEKCKLSKKQIYARFSHPIRFAGDHTKVWLDNSRGGICVAISWKGMKITGIDDRRYWTHISSDESRFNTIAYLQQIWWLEIDGKLEFEFPVGKYSLFFRLQLGSTSKGPNGRRMILFLGRTWEMAAPSCRGFCS
ncbi:hypothetical protein BUALT_Bualt06G0114900 [Buddleja alternifolia]|uniref:F-box domain-containing protein n=1 Tax=Buddleja alternifolia TaxID=168488 RepID=A0AAV6XM87_9LAMI|nr:hypothetical protein BUALT_Bualt06G0114900 [Buddleja alternifolia]